MKNTIIVFAGSYADNLNSFYTLNENTIKVPLIIANFSDNWKALENHNPLSTKNISQIVAMIAMGDIKCDNDINTTIKDQTLSVNSTIRMHDNYHQLQVSIQYEK